MSDPNLLLMADVVQREAVPLRRDNLVDYDPLLASVCDARFVLIGEASHGTHEFYRERAQITKRLILEKGFLAVAVEADFPDANRLNHYVSCKGDDADAVEAMGGFQRFPAWMWRNADVLDFIGWLRSHNEDLPPDSPKVGFYGLDLYSLHSSMESVLNYLDKVDPEGAQRARERYACFDHFGGDTQAYGYAAGLGISDSCEDEVVTQLLEMHDRAAELARRDGRVAADSFFLAEQNARLVKNAERYYRTMYRSDVSSWNIRDLHMMETLVAIEDHISHVTESPKIVIWEHNSHLGDASATEMGRRGEWNVGQLTRQRYGNSALSIGFTTHTGTVTAATDWGGPAERKRVRPSLPGSYERLFHETGIERFLLLMRDGSSAAAALRSPLLERAIGVI